MSDRIKSSRITPRFGCGRIGSPLYSIREYDSNTTNTPHIRFDSTFDNPCDSWRQPSPHNVHILYVGTSSQQKSSFIAPSLPRPLSSSLVLVPCPCPLYPLCAYYRLNGDKKCCLLYCTSRNLLYIGVDRVMSPYCCYTVTPS